MGVLALAREITTTNTEVELKQLDIRIKQSEINDLNKQVDELEQSDESNSKQIKKLKQQNEELQAKKAEEARIAAEQAKNAVYAQEQVDASPTPEPVVEATGDCASWMAQAGINNAQARDLIQRESGCRVDAINPTSGACGIPQALPCSKLPCTLDNAGAVCQLKWMKNYVQVRYGGWAGAIAHHDRMNWY